MSVFKPVVTSAGVLFVVSDIAEELAPGGVYSEHVVATQFRVGAVLGLAGVYALALALMAMHRRQADRVGRGALLAALICGFGILLLGGITWSTVFLDPAAAGVAPELIDDTPPTILVIGLFLSLAWFGLSWAVYCIVMLRAGVLPVAPVAVILVGALAAAVAVVPFAMAIFGLGLAWLGLAPARLPSPGSLRTPAGSGEQ